MKNLIKLSDTHYIIVDDSEIKEGYWCYIDKSEVSPELKSEVFQVSKVLDDRSHTLLDDKSGWRFSTSYSSKITHSTKPLEIIGEIYQNGKYIDNDYGFDEIERLSLSEVEELIYGYSVEEMAFKDTKRCGFNNTSYAAHTIQSFINGFKAHQELVKDKFILTKEQVEILIEHAREHHNHMELEKSKQYLLNSLRPKTEWNVEFVDGKLKLM